LTSVARAAGEVGVEIVTGDTKVVPRGAVDRLFITTSGLGERLAWPLPGPQALAAGDALIVSGPVGRHGFAVLAAREELGIEPPPMSDCGSLWPAVAALADAGVPVRALRDATRGGVAAVWHEWAETSGLTLAIEEASVPVTPAVRGMSELLGIDPLHVANEGTMVLAAPTDAVATVLAVLRGVPIAAGAAVVGRVEPRGFSPVTVRGALGRARPLDEPLGAPLPRIC
jgi:hydrogenase expression/formation protein HypE